MTGSIAPLEEIDDSIKTKNQLPLNDKKERIGRYNKQSNVVVANGSTFEEESVVTSFGWWFL